MEYYNKKHGLLQKESWNKTRNMEYYKKHGNALLVQSGE